MSRVDRKNRSLRHATSNQLSGDIVKKHAEALRNAVLTAIKSSNEGPSNHAATMQSAYTEERSNLHSALAAEWRQKSIEQIVEASSKWSDQVGFREIEGKR